MITAADAAVDQPPWCEGSVASVERRTTRIAVLRIAPTTPIPYRAGQSVSMETRARPRLWRYYSPATLRARTAPSNSKCGQWPSARVSTGIVQGSRAGDPVRFGAPVSEALTLDPDSHLDLVMIAGGTGLAAIKALLQQIQT